MLNHRYRRLDDENEDENGQLFYAFGHFTAPTTIAAHDYFQFAYPIPEQNFPGSIRFGIYTFSSDTTVRSLVAQSDTISYSTAAQTIYANVHFESSATSLQASTMYFLAVTSDEFMNTRYDLGANDYYSFDDDDFTNGMPLLFSAGTRGTITFPITVLSCQLPSVAGELRLLTFCTMHAK